MMVSIPMTFSSANSTEYLVSTVDRMMPLKELNSMKVRLLSTRFYVLVIISSFALTSGPSEVLSIRESHKSRDSISLKVKYIEGNLLDDHVSMIKHFSRLEVEHFNLQLKYQDLKERFGNKKPVTSSDDPSFDSLFVIGQLNEQIQSRGNTIHELKEKISRLTMKNSNADPIFDPKALVSQNKDLTAKLNALHDLNERPTQGKIGLCLYDVKTPKVFAFEKYAIDVELIPPRQRSNRNVHHSYLNSLKDTLDTLRGIVEEARTNANASTTSLRKKRVTFVEPCETSTHNTPAQVEHQKINSTNAPGIPSTRVKGASAASRSKPRSNTKKDRTLPAKSALKQVEAHSRMNKSNEKQKNRVDSSISYKRTVINLNSNTSCKTCNKCLISVNHDQCVVRSEMFVKQSPATKVWRVKQVKQVWKATGKFFTTIGHQWRPTGRLLPLGDQWPLTRNTPPKVLPTKQWKPTGRLLPLGRQCPLVRSTALKSDYMLANPQETIAYVVQIVLWYLDSGCSKHMVKKFIGTIRFGNDHFGAIMGYRDYVIGDSVISRVYYVEGLRHNLFSVGQFCDSDLEVAIRKAHAFIQRLSFQGHSEEVHSGSDQFLGDIVSKLVIKEATSTSISLYKADTSGCLMLCPKPMMRSQLSIMALNTITFPLFVTTKSAIALAATMSSTTENDSNSFFAAWHEEYEAEDIKRPSG
ncbi:hypothetical protein Tco_0861516 [Tanacetum coccineum]|uniref:Retrovirus-related Pol polyprotein from transposon TNT 1-94-like beta-barrel domain-containing protein n=1 Tax=Tanacetum coccineum TaxID=301880 RepID=A0ABQ5BM60_9ASTR